MARHYETSIVRAGWSIAAGGLLAGVITALLLMAGGQHSIFSLVIGGLIGSFFSAVGIMIVAGPAWLVFHLMQRRSAGYAALTGFIVSMLLFVGAQTYGFGLLSAPVTDPRTLLFRWASAGATALVLAVASVIIALVMWRIAYRRVL